MSADQGTEVNWYEVVCDTVVYTYIFSTIDLSTYPSRYIPVPTVTQVLTPTIRKPMSMTMCTSMYTVTLDRFSL